MDILQTVKDAIHANDVYSGTLNLATLELKLKEYTSSIEKIIKKFFEKKRLRHTNTKVERINRLENQYNFFLFDERFFAVPKEFQFPKNMWLKQAWSCWLIGFPIYRNNVGDENLSIVKLEPFQNIRPTLLQKKLISVP